MIELPPSGAQAEIAALLPADKYTGCEFQIVVELGVGERFKTCVVCFHEGEGTIVRKSGLYKGCLKARIETGSRTTRLATDRVTATHIATVFIITVFIAAAPVVTTASRFIQSALIAIAVFVVAFLFKVRTLLFSIGAFLFG